LPSYMIPSAFVALPALPLTPNGKVDRQALPAPDQPAHDLKRAYVASRSALEEVLIGMYAELLGVDEPGVHDDFFMDLGGHSLLATRLISRVRDVFDVNVPLGRVFEATTVASFAESILTEPQSRLRVEKTAEVLLVVQSMSDEEIERMLIGRSRPSIG
jgi:acyl carrier protein